ncbi:MAG: winged helix-turn-helix transcriptional regulator [Fervidicoccaceae archaeon]
MSDDIYNSINVFRNKLTLLKHLDSVIDFSRATSQLELIVYLYSVRKPISIDELASALGYSKKAVLDSLRKLEKKGLLLKEKQSDELKVSLSERGAEFVTRMIKLLKPTSIPGEATLPVPVRLNLAREIVASVNLYRLIVYVGLVKEDKPVSVKKVAKILGVPKEDLRVLLDSFTQAPMRLFKLVRINGEDVLLMDKQGVEMLRRTIHYRIYVTSRLYRYLVRLTNTPWIAEMALKINTGAVISVSGIAALLGLTKALPPIMAAALIVPALSLASLNAYLYRHRAL